MAFLAEPALGERGLAALALWPPGHGWAPWQVVSYAFLHASLAHLAFNMIGLQTFGSEIERALGTRRFAAYYLACVLSAALAQMLVGVLGGFAAPTVGASGGVFGLLLAFAVLFPHRQVMLLIPPIPMRARTLVIVYGALELVLGVTGTQEGVAHFAHLGGMAGGWLLLRRWRRAG